MDELSNLDKVATNLANCTLLDKKRKEMFRDTILGLVVNACKVYEKDKNFKVGIHNLGVQLAEKNKDK